MTDTAGTSGHQHSNRPQHHCRPHLWQHLPPARDALEFLLGQLDDISGDGDRPRLIKLDDISGDGDRPRLISLCCENLGIPDWRKEYATSRRIMFRHGRGSVADRIKRLYGCKLAASETARSAIDYLDRRRNNMRYGWLRKNGYYISSAHAEAAARILVARRCKQAGMHWRHHNAACVCALIAKIRSAA